MFDFYIQEPGMIVKHNGSYAHFVVTYIKSDSAYELWGILVGWETYTPEKILAYMDCEGALEQTPDGYLKEVSPENFLRTCTASCRLPKTSFETSRIAEVKRSEQNKINSTEGRKSKKVKRMNSLANLSKRNCNNIK